MVHGSYQRASVLGRTGLSEPRWHRDDGTVSRGNEGGPVSPRQTVRLLRPDLALRLLLVVAPARTRSTTPPSIDVRLQTSEVLKFYPGHAFCDDCLAGKVGYPVREVRRARIGLAGSTEFEQEMTFCSACLEQKHVIHVAWLRFDVAVRAEEQLEA